MKMTFTLSILFQLLLAGGLYTVVEAQKSPELNGFFWENPLDGKSVYNLGISASGKNPQTNSAFAQQMANQLSRFWLGESVETVTFFNQETGHKTTFDALIKSENPVASLQKQSAFSFPDGTEIWIGKTDLEKAQRAITVPALLKISEDASTEALSVIFQVEGVFLQTASGKPGSYTHFPFQPLKAQSSERVMPDAPDWFKKPRSQSESFLFECASASFALQSAGLPSLPDAYLIAYAKAHAQLASVIATKVAALQKMFAEETATQQTDSEDAFATPEKQIVSEKLTGIQLSKLEIRMQREVGYLYLEAALPVGDARLKLEETLKKNQELYKEFKKQKQ